MPLLTLFLGASGPQTLAFVDATGVNPLPPGVIVNVTLASSGAFVASGMLQAGGIAPFTLGYGLFTATFVGTQAPTGSVTFLASASGGSTITVPNCASPVFSAAGYAIESASYLTRGWFTNPANGG